MTFKFHCACGQKVSATEDMIGTSAVCPRCGSQVTVPRPPDPEPLTVSSPPPPSEAVPSPAPEAASPQPAPPTVAVATRTLPKPAPKRTTAAVRPVLVAPRPWGMLWLTAFLALSLALGTGGYLFRNFLPWVPGHTQPVAIATLSVIAASILSALLLRLAAAIVANLNLAFLEAWLVTVITFALYVLAAVPAAVVQLGLWPAEQGAKFLPVTGGGALLFTIVVYSFLIRTALGRPIGIARGVLTYILQLVFFGILGGVAFGVQIMYAHRT